MEAQLLGSQKALWKRQLVREWTVFLNAWVCWIVQQKLLFSWKNFLQMLHQAGYWICHRQLLAKTMRLCFFQSRGIQIRPPGYGLQSKHSPFFLMQNSHSGKMSFKGHKPFPCVTETTHALPLSRFSWIIKFWSNQSNPPFYRGKRRGPERLRDLP